ncbi:MAG: hypothetical protein ACI9XB_001302, partial [Gammaproteobacteria bacterium]
MYLTKILSILLVVGLLSSCQKETDSLSSALPIENSADNRASSEVNLGLAGEYAILSKTGVTDV